MLFSVVLDFVVSPNEMNFYDANLVIVINVIWKFFDSVVIRT